MKSKFMIVVLLFAVVSFVPSTVSAAGTFKDAKTAAEYLQKKFKEVTQAKKDFDNIPGLKHYNIISSVISSSEKAASLVWSLLKIGLTTNEKEFATVFAKRMGEHLKDYVAVTEAVGLYRYEDLQTFLFELGKNTYKNIQSQSEGEKQKIWEAGTAIETMTPAQIGRQVKAVKPIQDQLDYYEKKSK